MFAEPPVKLTLYAYMQETLLKIYSLGNCHDHVRTLSLLRVLCGVVEPESIPTLASLQKGLLNDPDHVDEMMALATQLLRFAIDDPGVPNPKEVRNVLVISGSQTKSL